MDASATVGVVVPTWNRAASALRCVGSLHAGTDAGHFVVVVDNGSSATEREALLAGTAARAGVEVVALPENRGFAGAVNVGLAAVFARGAAVALVVNDDAEVAPDVLMLLLAAARRETAAGILAPRVVDSVSGREVSRGERVILPLLCVPRTWLRVRGEA